METKFVVGLIVALIILGVLLVFIGGSYGLFENLIEWFKGVSR